MDAHVEAKLVDCCNCTICTCWIPLNGRNNLSDWLGSHARIFVAMYNPHTYAGALHIFNVREDRVRYRKEEILANFWQELLIQSMETLDCERLQSSKCLEMTKCNSRSKMSSKWRTTPKNHQMWRRLGMNSESCGCLCKLSTCHRSATVQIFTTIEYRSQEFFFFRRN